MAPNDADMPDAYPLGDDLHKIAKDISGLREDLKGLTRDAKKLGISNPDDYAPMAAVAMGLALRKVGDR